MKIQYLNPVNNNYKFSKKNVSRKENNYVASNFQASGLDILSSYNQNQVSFKSLEEHKKFKSKLYDLASKILYFQQQDNIGYSSYENPRITYFLSTIKPYNIDLAEELCFGVDEKGKPLFEDKEEIAKIISSTTEANVDFARKLCIKRDEDGRNSFRVKGYIPAILEEVNADSLDLAEKLCFGTDKYGHKLFPYENHISPILKFFSKEKQSFIENLCYGKDKFGRDLFDNKYSIYDVVSSTTEENLSLAEKLCYGQDKFGQQLFPNKKYVSQILALTDEQNIEVAEKMCFATDKYGNFIFSNKEEILDILVRTSDENKDEVDKLVQMAIDGKIFPLSVSHIVDGEISLNEFHKAKEIIGEKNLLNYFDIDGVSIVKLADIYKKEKIEDIPAEKRNKVLRNIINIFHFDFYGTVQRIKKDFPLLPTNRDEYSDLLKKIVPTIGIQTKPITKEQEQNFYSNVNNLSKELKTLTDEEYNNLSIELSYSKDDFIKDINNVLKGVDSDKKQKVLGHFGFGLETNDKVDLGYSITGYPLAIENVKEIQDETTKELIEQVRPFVVKFTEDNKVVSDNEQVETSLNEILKAFPELYSIVGKQQHATHSFDVFRHSLKVMQKVVQNSEFKKFDESDKKLLLLASLFHDVAKIEGRASSTHATTSAFESFYLIQKLDLTKDEKIKLYSLIKEHEWLGNVNKLKTDEQKLEQKKSSAYDLHYGNLFKMAKVFTKADLKAVKDNDSFYNMHKDAFEQISTDIECFIAQLKNTQPFLPVTKLPSASRIKEAITQVNDDCTTNLFGVFQDEKGMVILKFNDIEDETWEKIGFPKGSFSKGITATGFSKKNGLTSSKEYNTGNIKFFVHGLEREDQLANFDAFALPDSDALLSVSYTERPESKYRFFRNIGLVLNADAKYVHGGGKSDSGSGYTKNIDTFKRGYAYEGSKRYDDRKFISDLIKQELNMSDKEYLNFVKNNANKAFSEIEPKEVQTKLIQAFATINSKTRYGERNYNEMYLSNPEIMGVFAYDMDDAWIVSMKNFINRQQDFIKDYALKNDLPFIVFGG